MSYFDTLIFERFRMRLESQALLRILFAGYLIIEYIGWMAAPGPVPPGVWWPPIGPAAFMSPPSPLAANIISLILAGASALLLVGCFTRAVSLVIPAVMIVSRMWLFSMGGKVDHDILFVVAPVCRFLEMGRLAIN